MGKKLFFLSLILLSVVMGLNWYKTKPKKNIKPLLKNSSDNLNKSNQGKFQENKQDKIKTNESNNIFSDEDANVSSVVSSTTIASSSEEEQEAEKNASDNVSKQIKDIQNNKASVANDTIDNPNVSQKDPIILAFERLKKDPFAPSPYTQMLKEAEKKKQQDLISSANKPLAISTKPISLLNRNFLGTIETSGKLLAIIDGRLYKTGDLYNDIPILRVDKQIVLLENEEGRYIIPKKGVNVNIASDGTFTIEDNFMKQSSKKQ